MKTLLLTTLSIALFLSSCSSDGGQCKIAGQWKVIKVEVADASLPAPILEAIKSDYQNATYQFGKDGLLSVTNSQGILNNYSYRFDAEKGEISFSSEESEAEDLLHIALCSSDTLKVNQPVDASDEDGAKIHLTFIH